MRMSRHSRFTMAYCVLTWPSASTLRCSFDCSECTLSAGTSALVIKYVVSQQFCPGGGWVKVREALDQLELVGDLAALIRDLLLRATFNLSG